MSEQRKRIDKQETINKLTEKSFAKGEKRKEKQWDKPLPKKKVTVGCPVYKKCGQCFGQEEPYVKTIEQKQKKLKEILKKYCEAEPLVKMEDPYHYRKKAYAVYGHNKEGGHLCGVLDKKTGRVIPMENCFIDDKKAAAIMVTVKELLKSFKIRTCDLKSGNGLLRYVMVRNGISTGEIMVILVLSSDIMPSKNNFVKALRKVHPEIDTVIMNENYKNSTSILGDKESIIYGKGFIIDFLGGKEFRISSKSLFPANPVQAEQLYAKAISFAQLLGEEIVLDAYSGIGTIGMLVSEQVKKVISVDSNSNVVRDAMANLKRNHIKNVDCYTKDVTEFINQVAASEEQNVDIVFVNSPKNGCDKEFIDALVKLNPKKLICISHDLITLGSNLDYLTKKGFQVKRAVGVDMKPWTEAVETVVLFSRGSGTPKLR